MSEFITRLTKSHEVRDGVFVLPKQPSLKLLESADVFTAQDFGQAGIDAGKSSNYGQGVMREIALQMVTAEAYNPVLINGRESNLIERGMPEFDLYYEIFYLMKNPDLIKQGSRNQLLLSTQLVHDVWEVGEGRMEPEGIPRLGKVGHKVVTMLFIEELRAREEAEGELTYSEDIDSHHALRAL